MPGRVIGYEIIIKPPSGDLLSPRTRSDERSLAELNAPSDEHSRDGNPNKIIAYEINVSPPRAAGER